MGLREGFAQTVLHHLAKDMQHRAVFDRLWAEAYVRHVIQGFEPIEAVTSPGVRQQVYFRLVVGSLLWPRYDQTGLDLTMEPWFGDVESKAKAFAQRYRS